MIADDDPLVAALGIDSLAVIATPDAVLASRTADARIHHPVEGFQTLHGGGFQVKRIIIKPGAAISLQRHRHRAEHWIVLCGTAEVVKDGESFVLRTNETNHVPPLWVHRLANPGLAPLDLIEVRTGCYLSEDDLKRFEDSYGGA